jgi:hypothetical protein
MTPLAGASRFEMVGDWPYPSFQGAPLPEDRSVTDSGFTANWTVPGLSRGYGAIWYGASVERSLNEASKGGIGFRHVRPDDFYNAAARSVKYGVLFVTLTFLACFVLERFGGRRLHTAQYGLVGLSLALLYLLLIALAEHIGLFWAYLSAASVIAGMNAAYIGAATALALLCGAFYVMLESEDNALLIGAGLLLIGLAMGMVATVRMGAAKSQGLVGSRTPGAKNGATHTYVGCAKFHGGRVVSAHAHGHVRQTQAIRHVFQKGEVGRRGILRRRDAHQADDIQPMDVTACGDKGLGVGRGDAGLLLFLTRVDLNETGQTPLLLRHNPCKGGGDPWAVNGLDHVEQTNGFPRFVGL